jgi:PAS domain S-box-containing protein
MPMISVVLVAGEAIPALNIKNQLQSLGYAVVGSATSGRLAIETVAITNPDIALVDGGLKGEVAGIEVAEQIRAQFGTPVVLLATSVDEAMLEWAQKAEPDDYLLIPVETKELNATIKKVLYRHRVIQKLKENELWLRTALNSISDAVITTDIDGRVNFMNPEAEALTGWPEVEATRNQLDSIVTFMDEETKTLIESPSRRVLQAGSSTGIGKRPVLLSRNGKKIPVAGDAAPLKDDNLQIRGVVLTLRDVTPQRENEVKLRGFAEQLQAQNEELDGFAHTVAHDLQNPLSNLVAMADAVRTYHTSMNLDELDMYLGRLVQNGLKMATIVDSLLLLAGIRRRENLELSVLDTAKIVAEVLQHLSAAITEANAEICLPESWPAAVGYAPWVEEIWSNYLSNAIKYGGQPPVIRLGADVVDNETISFWVEDNGIGLTEEEQAQLFVPFTKLSQVHTKGTGLGLSIVRRIVERLNGTVGVTSAGPGHGSRFSFTLPTAGLPRPSDEV